MRRNNALPRSRQTAASAWANFSPTMTTTEEKQPLTLHPDTCLLCGSPVQWLSPHACRCKGCNFTLGHMIPNPALVHHANLSLPSRYVVTCPCGAEFSPIKPDVPGYDFERHPCGHNCPGCGAQHHVYYHARAVVEYVISHDHLGVFLGMEGPLCVWSGNPYGLAHAVTFPSERAGELFVESLSDEVSTFNPRYFHVSPVAVLVPGYAGAEECEAAGLPRWNPYA